jgi:uncharacterized membrane protein
MGFEREDELMQPSNGDDQQNVGRVERVVSAAVGSALILGAMRKPSPARAAWAIGGGALVHRGVTGHCYVYEAVGKNTARVESSDRPSIERSITIGKPSDELYRAWRDPAHLAAIMGHFARVEQVSSGQHRWTVHMPGGREVQWTTSTIEDTANERIVWQSDPGAPVAHRGLVRFRPAGADRGTVVTLQLTFNSPQGVLAKVFDRWLSSLPKALEESVLRRSKSLCETGEIPTLEHNPSGRTRVIAARVLPSLRDQNVRT